jgi:type I restriction enzyme M protein
VKQSLAGYDANPTVWSLAMLNMFFRGDGKTNVAQGDSLATRNLRSYEGKYTRSYLNPPFSQDEEPEYRFIDNAAAALEPEGKLAAVVYAGVFADEDHENWRRSFLKRHRLLAMISLPDDLFYPNGGADDRHDRRRTCAPGEG